MKFIKSLTFEISANFYKDFLELTYQLIDMNFGEDEYVTKVC